MGARPRVVRSGEALLLERRSDGPLGERWDLPRTQVPVAVRTEEALDGFVAVWAHERTAVEAPLAWHALDPLRASWRAGAIALSADAAAIVRGADAATIVRGAEHELRLAAREGEGTLELAPALRMLAVRTPTLPPATHTNVFVVGSREAVLIEPATPYADELDRIAEWVGALEGDGVIVRAILATHHHPDHVGGARALSELLGVPIAAHAETDVRLPRGLRAGRRLADGERIVLEGPEPITLRAVLTPGHAPGHLCFLDEGSRVLVAGDMVAGTGTILVEPGDGDMALYLESLRRMSALDPSALAPAHGGAMRPPRVVLERYVEHRLAREERVLAALARRARGATAAELLPDAYGDAPRSVWPLAMRSTEAHLIKLAQDGRAERTASGWRALSPDGRAP